MRSISNQKNPNTALWRARRRCGFERKQVAWMLGHKTSDSLARYERGESEPSFDNAIRLSIIYRRSLDELLPHKYAALRTELTSKALTMRPNSNAATSALFTRVNVCTYEEAFQDPIRSAHYFPFVRDHVTKLAKLLAGL
jgi:transcriptional regulator with XRE-family HTH domain